MRQLRTLLRRLRNLLDWRYPDPSEGRGALAGNPSIYKRPEAHGADE